MEQQQCLAGLEDDRTIFRVAHDRDRPYIVVNKESAQDGRFDGMAWMAARHMLTLMLGQPDDWRFNLRHLADLCHIHKDVAAALMQLLIQAGYVVRDQSRRNSGRFGGIRYLVYECPTVSALSRHGDNPAGTHSDAEEAILPVLEPKDPEKELITVSAITGHGADRERSHRTRSDRYPVEPCPVIADILSNQETTPTPLLPEPSTEGREEPTPAATPKPAEEKPPRTPTGAEIAEASVFLEQLADDYRNIRRRKFRPDPDDAAHLVALIRDHGQAAVRSTWRRDIAAAKPDKKLRWIIHDLDPPLPPTEQRKCSACGAVMTSRSCLRCGVGQDDAGQPALTQAELQEELAKLPWLAGVRPKGATQEVTECEAKTRSASG